MVTRGHAELGPFRKTGHDSVIFAAVRTSVVAAGAALPATWTLRATHVDAAHDGAARAADPADPAATLKAATAAPAMAPRAKRMLVLIWYPR